MNNPAAAKRVPEAWISTEKVAATIEEAVTAIRLEAERRDLGTGMILVSAERLRHILRGFFLA
jgi:hypothetical protein